VDDLTGKRNHTPKKASKYPKKAIFALPFGAMNASNLETSIAIGVGAGGSNSDARMRPNESLAIPNRSRGEG
jgi:hypothetical protein